MGVKIGLAGTQGVHQHRTKVAAQEIQRQAQGQAIGPREVQRVEPIILTPQLIEGFVERYLRHRFDDPQPIPQLHRELWADYCLPDQFVANAAPRGHAKSTSITHSALLADLLFRNVDYAVIVSNTWSQGTEFLRDLRDELHDNDDLILDFQVKKFLKDSEDNLIVLMADGHKFRVTVRGVEQKIRGLKWGHKRPNCFVLDDIEDDEQVESKDRREKLSNWVLKALVPAGSKRAKVRMLGTIMHFDSFLANALKVDQRVAKTAWKGRVFKAHRSYDDFTEILWPEMFTEERLRKLRQIFIDSGNPDGYSSEYLNNPIAEQDAFFSRDKLLPIPESISEQLVAGRLRLRKYVGWDFAVSKDERADFTRWGVIGMNAEGYKFGLKYGGARMASDEIIEAIFKVEKDHKPEFHVVERGVIEKSLGPFFYTECRKRGVYPKLLLLTSTKDKRTRAKSFQGAVNAGHFYFNTDDPEWPTVRDELVRFDKGEFDDYVDVHSIVCRAMEDMHEADTDEQAEIEDDLDQILAARQQLAALGIGRNARTGY